MLVTKLTAIADAIRGKTGKTDGLTLDQMAAEIAGIEAGGGGGDNPLDYACSGQRLFMYATFPSGTELNISMGKKADPNANQTDHFTYFAYRTVGLKAIKLSNYAIYPNAISFMSAFEQNSGGSATELEKVDLTEFVDLRLSNINRTFCYARYLKEILGEINVENCTGTNNTFYSCSALETVRFKAGTIKVSISFSSSSKLTDATIQNIIDGLADLTGGTAQTLTLHATVGAKLTDAQKSAASAKNWTISY